MSKPYHDRDTLLEAYRECGSQKAVAKKYGVSWYTIQNWMDKHDLPTFQLQPDHPVYDPTTLSNLYSELNSISAVAEELGVSENTVMTWMDEHGIEKNKLHPDRGNKMKVECNNCGNTKTVYECFLTNGRTFCGASCQGEWLSKNNVGEDHPLYDGGAVQNYGSGWENARKKVLARDKVCQVCDGVPNSRQLDIHHINPVSEFSSPEKAHSLDNLVALCRKCHRKIEKHPEEKQREILQ